MNILARANFSGWLSCWPGIRFRQSKLVLGLLIVLCVFPTRSAVAVTSTDHDVVIVGAGTAGLYAAYVLNGLGYDVLLLEATHRHGGRCYPDMLGDVGIERGAEEIYNASGGVNFVYTDIVAEFGSGDLRNWYGGGDVLYVMDADDPNGPTLIWDNDGTSDPDVLHWWDYSPGSYSNHGSDPLQSDFLASNWGVDPNNRAYHFYETDTGFWGTSTDRIGIRSYSRERNAFELSGAKGHRTMGYLHLLNAIYFDDVTGPGAILYNSPVTVVDTSGIKPVAIDANGVWHYADAIIVCVSLGVLKANLIDFVPDHSVEKQEAIDTIGMGRGMKIFLQFSSQFWPNFGYVYSGGPSQFLYSNKQVKTTANDHVITCFLMGTGADAMDALPNDAARMAQAVADLDDAFGVFGDPDPSIATPATTLFVGGDLQNWTYEPYVLGSYSYPAPGTRPLTGLTMRQILAQPVGSTLFFAGEATNNKNAATVVGAIQTGKRAGEEVDATLGGPPAGGTPTANFSASATNGVAPFYVSFTDLSSDTPNQWDWDYGDVATATAQNPSHLFTAPGTYTVILTATNASGSHTRVLPLLITVTGTGILGDINTDGAMDGLDWTQFVASLHEDLSELTPLQQFAKGDLNTDGFNNYADLQLFKIYYDQANGLGAFEAMVAAEPEPIGGDFNGDGYVDNDDLAIWEANYGQTIDGQVYNGAAYLEWQQNYTGPGPVEAAESASIEEDAPATGKKGRAMGERRRNESGNWRGGKKEKRNQGEAAVQ